MADTSKAVALSGDLDTSNMMQLFAGQMLGQQQNPLTIAVIKMIESISVSESGWKGIIKQMAVQILGKLAKIVLVGYVVYYASKPKEIGELIVRFIKFIIEHFCYKKLIFQISEDKTELEFYINTISSNLIVEYNSYVGGMGNQITNNATTSSTTNSNSSSTTTGSNNNNNNNNENKGPMFKIFRQRIGKTLIIRYWSILPDHSRVIDEMYKNANEELEKYMSTSLTYMQYDQSQWKTLTPSGVFPAQNHILLSLRIQSMIRLGEITGIQSRRGIIVNSEAGFGKSFFAEFVANPEHFKSSSPLIKAVIKIDFSQYNDKTLEEMFSIISKISTDKITIIILDEIDKYLKKRMEIKYEALKQEQQKNAAKSAGVIDLGPSSSNAALTDSPLGLNVLYEENKEERDAFEVKEKTNFATLMKQLMDNRVCTTNILVFMTNNYATMFNGIDMVHYAALKDRFNFFQFHQVNNAEFKNYFKWFNGLCKIKEPELYIEEQELNTLLNTLREDLNITYRELRNITDQMNNDLRQIIRHLNKDKKVNDKDNKTVFFINSDEEIKDDDSETNNSEEQNSEDID